MDESRFSHAGSGVMHVYGAVMVNDMHNIMLFGGPISLVILLWFGWQFT